MRLWWLLGVILWATTGLFADTVASPEVMMEDCAASIRDSNSKQNQLLAIFVAGRATGSHIPEVAKSLGFKIVHVYPKGLASKITGTFPASLFDFPPIEYDRNDLAALERELRALAQENGLELVVSLPAMDYGVVASDFVSSRFNLPGNSAAENEWRTVKGRLESVLGKRGVPVARTESLPFSELELAGERLPFPCYIRATESWGSIGSAACLSLSDLPTAIAEIQRESAALRHPVGEVVVSEFLYPNSVPFVDTVSAMIGGRQKRIVTGIWIDSRGEDFPSKVWDLIVMLPPPHLLKGHDRELFQYLLEANELALDRSQVVTGTTHLEFMARTTLDLVTSAEQLFPNDLNLRHPGLKAPHLERRATGIDPYLLDVAARYRADLIANIPNLYTEWREHVALVFLRSKRVGRVSWRGRTWLQKLLNNPQARPDGAYLLDIRMGEIDSPVSITENGDSMQGFLHVAGPTQEAIKSLYTEIRAKERAHFFVD